MRTSFLAAFFVVTVVYALPMVSFAALVPPCAGNDCQTCDVVKLGTNILSFLVTMMASLGAIVIAIAGFKMVMSGGDPGAIKEARGMITNIVVGFIIMLSAWLVVDTVMKMFVKDDLAGFGPWNEIQCVAPTPVDDSTPPDGTSSADVFTHANALTLLGYNHIAVVGSGGIVQANCGTTSGCTSLEGIRRATLDEAIALKAACGCSITITGGTEGVHSNGTFSHANGYKFDARVNATLDNYITSTYTNIGVRSDGATMYKSSSGAVYAREGDHWDVLVK